MIRAKSMLGIAGLCGGLGVLIGAFGAHGLPEFLASREIDDELLTKRIDQFDVGVQYHLIHAIALLAISTTERISSRSLCWIGVFFLAGIILFSGSLYLLVATNTSALGMITPIGGISWIIGWAMLAIQGLRVDQTD